MNFGIDTLKLEDGRCLAVDASGGDEDLALSFTFRSTFLAVEGEWHEVDLGQVEAYDGQVHGQDYRGPAVWFRYGGSLAPGRVFPTPGAPLGAWVACELSPAGCYWLLETGMLIRAPFSGGDLASGTYPFAPGGRCVASLSRFFHPFQAHVDGTEVRFALRRVDLGKLAFDLAHPPFPPELWPYAGGAFRETDLEVAIRTEDHQLACDLIGGTDNEAIFWLF